MKYLILTILAITAMLIPTSGVFADTQFWEGQATVNVTSPTFVVSLTEGGIAIPDGVNITKTVAAGYTVTQTFWVKNNSTTAYSVVPNIIVTDGVGNASAAITVTGDASGVAKLVAAGASTSFTYTATATGPYTTPPFKIALTFSYR